MFFKKNSGDFFRLSLPHIKGGQLNLCSYLGFHFVSFSLSTDALFLYWPYWWPILGSRIGLRLDGCCCCLFPPLCHPPRLQWRPFCPVMLLLRPIFDVTGGGSQIADIDWCEWLFCICKVLLSWRVSWWWEYLRRECDHLAPLRKRIWCFLLDQFGSNAESNSVLVDDSLGSKVRGC